MGITPRAPAGASLPNRPDGTETGERLAQLTRISGENDPKTTLEDPSPALFAKCGLAEAGDRRQEVFEHRALVAEQADVRDHAGADRQRLSLVDERILGGADLHEI